MFPCDNSIIGPNGGVMPCTRGYGHPGVHQYGVENITTASNRSG